MPKSIYHFQVSILLFALLSGCTTYKNYTSVMAEYGKYRILIVTTEVNRFPRTWYIDHLFLERKTLTGKYRTVAGGSAPDFVIKSDSNVCNYYFQKTTKKRWLVNACNGTVSAYSGPDLRIFRIGRQEIFVSGTIVYAVSTAGEKEYIFADLMNDSIIYWNLRYKEFSGDTVRTCTKISVAIKDTLGILSNPQDSSDVLNTKQVLTIMSNKTSRISFRNTETPYSVTNDNGITFIFSNNEEADNFLISIRKRKKSGT